MRANHHAPLASLGFWHIAAPRLLPFLGAFPEPSLIRELNDAVIRLSSDNFICAANSWGRSHANKASTGLAESLVAQEMICDSVGASLLKCRMRVMKSASLSSLRVTPELREATEQVWRGQAACDEAKQSGQYHDVEEVMASLRDVLAVRHPTQEGFC